ncbi:MAG: HAD family hydrolase [Anaerolineae bacterium]|nr:HAD family hydrolase [Anaerolineae bacterium]
MTINRAIIWDFDGTLGYRDGGSWSSTLKEILDSEEPGNNITRELIRANLWTGFPWQEWQSPHPHLRDPEVWWGAVLPLLARAYCGAGLDGARAGALARRFRDLYLDLEYWRCFEDTLPTLETLSGRGWHHILLSNHVPELRAILRQIGLDSHLTFIFNSAETDYEKPHPRAFEMVLEAIPDAQTLWMVGDNFNADVQGAAAFGIPGILVHREHPDAQYMCATLEEAGKILDSGF